MMKTLLQRARSGDDEAFAELFQMHAGALWRTAMGCMHDENDAADALQEATIKAWRAIATFDERSDISTWLTRILLNTCFDALRAKKKLIPFADLSEVASPSPERPSSRAAASALEAPRESTTDRLDVEAVLRRLSENDRALLTLFYVNDFSTAQVAEIFGISQGAVRTRLTRARARFKEIYETEGLLNFENTAERSEPSAPYMLGRSSRPSRPLAQDNSRLGIHSTTEVAS